MGELQIRYDDVDGVGKHLKTQISRLMTFRSRSYSYRRRQTKRTRTAEMKDSCRELRCQECHCVVILGEADLTTEVFRENGRTRLSNEACVQRSTREMEIVDVFDSFRCWTSCRSICCRYPSSYTSTVILTVYVECMSRSPPSACPQLPRNLYWMG